MVSAETAVLQEALPSSVKTIGAPSKPIWSKTSERTSLQNAFYHWEKHGKEFVGIKNSKQNVEHAWKFRDRTDVMIKVRTNGERILYDPKSNTFGTFTARGIPKTVFKPTDRIEYFHNQKGVPYGIEQK